MESKGKMRKNGVLYGAERKANQRHDNNDHKTLLSKDRGIHPKHELN